MPDPAWSKFLEAGLREAAPLLGNARVDVHAVTLGGEIAPVVLNTARTADTSWVVSLRNAYGPYARAEVREGGWGPGIRVLALGASHAGEALLVAGGFSGGCYLDSWLVSTDLHAARLTSADVLGVLDEVARIAPREPIVIRSLTPSLHGELLGGLARAGFVLLPTRQVWLLADPAGGAWHRHRNAQRDLELAARGAAEWQWLDAHDFSADDFGAAQLLYQQLYRQRYPRFNPDYSVEYLRRGVATGFLNLSGLRATRGGALRACVGIIERDGVATTPLVGYDLAAPRELGLYRLAMLRSWQHAERRGLLLHSSAGSGAFKESRGARSAVEFAAVWAGHLPRARRACLAALAQPLRRWAIPYMERTRL